MTSPLQGRYAPMLAIALFGAAGLPRPDFEAWLKQDRPAIPSRLAQALRR